MFLCFLLLLAVVLFMVVLYLIYRETFRINSKRGISVSTKSKRYKDYLETIRNNIDYIRSVPHEVFEISSKCGKKLTAKYYHFKDGAPVAIFFHGYRSFAEFDASSVFRIFENRGMNILLVNQRAHGNSKIKTISFGVRESEDCLLWADYIAGLYGNDTKIVLAGMSMGASTVLMASDKKFTADVRGIIADCGFYSPGEVLRYVIKCKGYNVKFMYFMVKLSAVIYGGFNPDKHSTGIALSRSDIPVLFIHGDKDTFVPYDMGVKSFDSAKAEKKFVTISGAGHAVSAYVNPGVYEDEINEFFIDILG